MDFVSDALTNGRRIKCLTVADDFSHECVQMTVAHGIGGAYVVRLLDDDASFRAIRGRYEPTATQSPSAKHLSPGRGIEQWLIEPGRPMQNSHIESFNSKFRTNASTGTGSRR